MKEYQITENVGEEICLKRGDATLVVKVGKDSLIPDFVSSVANEIVKNPPMLINALERVWHRNPRGVRDVEEALGWYRDQAFNAVKEEEKKETPNEGETTAKTTKKSKK